MVRFGSGVFCVVVVAGFVIDVGLIVVSLMCFSGSMHCCWVVLVSFGV